MAREKNDVQAMLENLKLIAQREPALAGDVVTILATPRNPELLNNLVVRALEPETAAKFTEDERAKIVNLLNPVNWQSSETRRDSSIKIRVTESERVEIENRAKAHRLSVSEYLRRLGLGLKTGPLDE